MLLKHSRNLKRFRNFDYNSNLYVVKHYVKGEKAIIPIQIKEYSDLFSPYHPGELVLNKDIIEYIEQIVYYIPYQYSVVLELTGISFTEEMKVHIVGILTQHFGLVAHDKKVELKFNTKKIVTLFIVGFIFLYISYLFFTYRDLKFINDVISIAGTFFIWEGVNTLWLERTTLKIASLNAGQLACSTVSIT